MDSMARAICGRAFRTDAETLASSRLMRRATSRADFVSRLRAVGLGCSVPRRRNSEARVFEVFTLAPPKLLLPHREKPAAPAEWPDSGNRARYDWSAAQ